ncbi:MAG: hypothetical protein RL563_2628 [Pseudomonadota bacterium]
MPVKTNSETLVSTTNANIAMQNWVDYLDSLKVWAQVIWLLKAL